MIIGGRNFDFTNGVYIMGILNYTPDSFSDNGKFFDIDRALYHVEDMISSGADIIDIGGESTRPGYTEISADEEIARVCPVIEAVKERFDVPISLDSCKSEVVSANLGRIDLINDVWGLKRDKAMAQTAAQSGLPCCIVHNRRRADYDDFLADFFDDIKQSLDIAAAAGIDDSKIILDGGVGFAKTYEQNLTVINHTDDLAALGYPVMLAASRKSVIGLTVDRPTHGRLAGTVAVTAVGVMKGARIIRVHDVSENCDAVKMTKSIIGEKKWER